MARMEGAVGVSGVGGKVEMMNGCSGWNGWNGWMGRMVDGMDGIRKYGICGLFLTYILTLSKIRLNWNRLEWIKIERIYQFDSMECYWWKSDKVGENLTEICVEEYGWVNYECRIKVEYEWNMGGN